MESQAKIDFSSAKDEGIFSKCLCFDFLSYLFHKVEWHVIESQHMKCKYIYETRVYPWLNITHLDVCFYEENLDIL